MVPTGFAEAILARCPEVDDPAVLWDTATTCAALAQKWNGHGAEKNEIKSAQMFVEVELGQRLYLSECSHGDNRTTVDIPRYIASDLRRFYGHRGLLVSLIREGLRSRRSLLLAIDRATAVDVDPSDINVMPGDFREVLQFENASVALVLTDPPYATKYLPLWSDLGKYSAQWLIPGGSLVAYCGQSILPDALERLSRHLRYWWTICLLHEHGTAMIPGKNVSSGWKPMVWFVQDNRRGRFMVADRVKGSPPRKTIPTGDADADDWAQGVSELEGIISGLTDPGDLIVDPFAGSGSVGIAALRFGRRFIGADL
jgi:site-specific DNA-methyltransferase (adenine-specific)